MRCAGLKAAACRAMRPLDVIATLRTLSFLLLVNLAAALLAFLNNIAAIAATQLIDRLHRGLSNGVHAVATINTRVTMKQIAIAAHHPAL